MIGTALKAIAAGHLLALAGVQKVILKFVPWSENSFKQNFAFTAMLSFAGGCCWVGAWARLEGVSFLSLWPFLIALELFSMGKFLLVKKCMEKDRE